MSEHQNALPSGYQIQEYELLRVLGSGGFAITYLAFDNNTDRGCAIKEYLPRYLATREAGDTVVANSEKDQEEFDWGLERFLAEARTLAKFDDTNIVKVYRSFSANGTGYIVMEYAEGDTFSEYLDRKGKLGETELKKVLIPMLKGLAKVHSTDFLHRDIKPLNIIIRDSDESGVLIDFGSARQAIGAKDQHLTALVSGGYAPIEQYSSRGNQGPWTDIYALGALCYRAMCGEDPYAATDRIKDDPLIPISKKLKGKASPGFLKAIDWTLKVDEQERPQNVAEWIAALEGRPGDEKTVIAASPAESSSKSTSGQATQSKPVGTYAAAAALVLSIGIGAWYFTSDTGTETIDGAEQGSDQNSEQTSVVSLSEDELFIQQARRSNADIATQIQDGTLTVETYEPELVLVNAGSFDMGDIQGGGDSDEAPVRRVDIPQDFYLSKHEISYADYLRFTDATGREMADAMGFGFENKPVINVSWQDADAYGQWLSELTGKTYRLPSEAEWEYAARAGTTTNYPWGNELQLDKANCASCKSDNSESGPGELGSYGANLSGLHDMNGNVWEWVQDCAHDGYVGAPVNGSAWETDPACSRVLRGGAWDSTEFQLRTAFRNWRPANESSSNIGFRLLRE
ncbi:MAG: SUMF1/EgtB/PvdO family nonheme iron enzyme [Gammaproteobacteria bacterium]|jgi:formylglycine-generating enzyme required for sulfatase activity|nr:SUMF1/EgtB/PvdO family nonheme iron enzyme [Gammaproteobacteria bacterium]MBT3860981.1 SUMF1/EgtB/PvdO family nonheme iron enzyme [Gammaproteobacteria bacterium]MBT3986262.1 SUMF1/EgtB/PvdO family nonheme iron enzyme [Gammaproteobacteria bacterium]MBT4254485.1 SUMF1/EgtB/PvdO family nonheme iron enzyme [Gammaproteobacteria bacterium]MBT4582664.1 SUMF1/EgtB/PvdO family nonheme iron enzyme [Gammaproteobacteria bacterium]